ncbi:PREDICTED: coiled-coil domain-containing protein R3HCC1L [Cyphomyrmex costatus]|uniref:Growth inhibition and differentiation-related protein 88 like protein n=1 Tax=Cyphomyrmex costatus TaxID=456900 RepID=A0A151IG96_9HYME|nr:PREDICTED: coiled-coil domain-containing protein R3HCC1L [Cyphomyrmex costatus]KYN00220.1 Growth inhibition and differentiation-related protein 88 like protein [Cyphomyrmex costatus]
MSLQDSLFSEDVEYDVIAFTKDNTPNRVLVFPPVNNYRRFIIHQLIQDRFSDLLHTFSIGQGSARRTVVCYKTDVRSDWNPKPNFPECKTNFVTKRKDTSCGMGIEGRRSPSTSPECKLQRQAKSIPTAEIYRPPAARKLNNCSQINSTQTQVQSTTDFSSVKNVRQKRPDRAVYVPRHRRSLEIEDKKPQSLKVSHTTLNEDSIMINNSKLQDVCCSQQNVDDLTSHNQLSESCNTKIEDKHIQGNILKNVISLDSDKISEALDNTEHMYKFSEQLKDVPILFKEKETVAINNLDTNSTNFNLLEPSNQIEINDKQSEKIQENVEEKESSIEYLNCSDENDHKDKLVKQNVVSDVLIISDSIQKKSKQSEQLSPILVTPPEKKVKKIERQKSKPAPPPSPPLKMNRDECDWDSLFDDNGDCLDPTLIEELTSAVGEVVIEQPKNDYKAYSKQIEVSSDEFAHVVEIYNFPSEFKTSDLAAVFSSFKNGGFELKWVDDTHCLGVFSSPFVAAEVLASNHPFVKTRPLSEATALSKTKARRSAEFLQPYRNRPETCAALARRLVTGALGVKLATARQEREHEKNILREAKEKRRLANKQREDVWEGIIPTK